MANASTETIKYSGIKSLPLPAQREGDAVDGHC